MSNSAEEPAAQTTGQTDPVDDTMAGSGQPDAGTGATEDWKANLPPQALAYIEELQRTARGHTKAAEDARKELDELKRAQMSEEDKAASETQALRDENLQLKTMVRTQALQRVATEVGRTMGARNPDRIWRFLDRESIVWDDQTGDPTNIQSLMSGLKKTDDYLFNAPQSSGSIDGGSKGRKSTGGDMNSRIRAAAGRRAD